MATCYDCLHFIVCEALEQGNGIKKVHPIQCGCFKDKADVVKVVRCKDCKHKVDALGRTMCSRTAVKKGNGWFGLTAKEENHFCSYGELKEREGK